MIERLGKEVIDAIVEDNCNPMTIVLPIGAKPVKKIPVNNFYTEQCVVQAEKYKVLCTCEKGKGNVVETVRGECPFCGKGVEKSIRYYYKPEDGVVPLFSAKSKKEVQAFQKKENLRRVAIKGNFIPVETRHQRISTYYVREKGDGSGGIDIVRLRVIYSVDDEDNIKREEKYDCYAEIVPGKKIKAYKKTKTRGVEEISLFDAFHITSDNVLKDENIVFEGAQSMLDFMYYNKQFADKTGFLNILLNYRGKIPENSLFLMYMYLLSEYPVIELLAKMGYYTLILSLLDDIGTCYRRNTIRERVNNLSSLLNQTTKGSASLSVPTYIGKFLNEKGADVKEYMAYAAINEFEPISKEHFEDFLNSEAYMYFNYYKLIHHMPNIIKYGYKPREITKYVMKQYYSLCGDKMKVSSVGRWGVHDMVHIMTTWKDYLEICELIGVEAARFPKNLQAVHDDASAALSAKKNVENDKKIKAIADMYKDFKTESSSLCVVFPECVNDFVVEGNEQHNCVAGYSHNVINGYCRIFFIRRADDPKRSYITGECRKSGLGQLMYRNNQGVDNYVEVNLAKAVCKHILSKPWEPKGFH